MVAASATTGRAGAPPEEGPRFALRFEEGRGLLTLAQPLRFAHGVVEELELSLGALRFPLDLRAGARRFRTRRTLARKVRVRLDPVALLAHRVEEPYRLEPLAPGPHTLGWALSDPFGTVAFEVLARVEGADLWLAVTEARSVHEGPVPPAVRALAAARALGLELDEARGALRVPRVLSGVLLDVLVPHGWRVPDERALRVSVEVQGSRHVVLRGGEHDESRGLAEPWEHARRLGPLLAAMARGDEERARRGWSALLERVGAPPEGLLRAARGLHLGAEDDAGLVEGRAPQGPAGPQAWALRLRRALREARVADAVSFASRLADLEPCDAVAVEGLCAAAELARGADPAACVALLERAVARRPRDGRLTLRLVEALAQGGSTSGALAATLDTALSAREPGPERGALARDAALVCALAQRHDDADRLWGFAMEGLPQDPRVLDGVAGLEARRGRLEAAIALWDRAAEAFERDGDPDGMLRALTAAAGAAERAGRLDVAEERLTRAVDRGGASPERWAALARARRRLAAGAAARRAEDALLESLQGLPPAAVTDEVLEALRGAMDEAPAGSERARAFASALARLRPGVTEVLASSLDEPATPSVSARTEPATPLVSAPTEPATPSVSARTEPATPSVSAPTEPATPSVSARTEPATPSVSAPTEPATPSVATPPSGSAPREPIRPEDPLLERARAAAEARDTAGLRAALAAAERAGDRLVALQIVDLALAVVGAGPARQALLAARARL